MKQERINEIDKELEQYGDVLKKIEALKAERKKLQKQLDKERFDALPFEKQFSEWFGSGRIVSDLYQLKCEVPLFKDRFVGHGADMDRYKTYRACEWYGCEELYAVCDEEQREDMRAKYSDNASFEEAYNELLEIAKELMKKNVGGWVCDW